MGSSFNKDPHAQLFITLDKHINYAGQMVSGAVHINCTADRICYQQLRLRIDGKEHSYWSERRGNHTYVYSNKRETYRADVELARIPSGLMRGHYSFPFSFLLPAAMPSSFQIDRGNYVKYRIYAVLVNPQNYDNEQVFRIPLHVREPPKGPPVNLSGETISESKCCNCFCSCGYCRLALTADVAYIEYAKSFRIRGEVDTAMSKTPVQDYKVVLREVITKAASSGKIKRGSRDFVLFNTKNQVSIGQKSAFEG